MCTHQLLQQKLSPTLNPYTNSKYPKITHYTTSKNIHKWLNTIKKKTITPVKTFLYKSSRHHTSIDIHVNGSKHQLY